MPAVRCTLCARNFPEAIGEVKCPICNLDTLTYGDNLEVDDIEETISLVKHADFERYLEANGRL